MDVITTHINADFDCLGAMVAARRLYPDAEMVFAGAQERSLREFFLRSTAYAYDFKRIRDIDLDSIERLILVDVRQSDRIGPFGEVARRQGTSVHIYDHHPSGSSDLTGSLEVIRPVGSTVTVFCQLFMEQGICPTADEATLMMLGLYEDTGSLQFSSTTRADFEAAAFLLDNGATLSSVSEFLTQELTAEQVGLLHQLIENRQVLTINGLEISVSQASVEQYVGDLAVLANKLKDMENLDALIIVVRMGDRVLLIGRSRVREVDVGSILEEFGGGGHAFAASGTVRDQTLVQILDRLPQVLQRQVNPRWLAHQMMSSPARTVPLETTISAVREQLTRYNINVLPVLDAAGEVVGLISRQTVDKAAHHQLGEHPVGEYMDGEFEVTTPDTPLQQLQELIIGRNQRLVPVVVAGKIAGVLTRTDLLRQLISMGRHPAGEGLPGSRRLGGPWLKKKQLARFMRERLPKQLRDLLQACGEIGDELGLNVYVVGGFVRDLLLRQDNYDVDLVVEGDGIDFARQFAKRHPCRVRSHSKFGTAVMIFADGLKVDVASARMEYYQQPAALPTVEYASIKLDLFRRDFTINTLAIALSGHHFGELLDFFGGQQDLKDRALRVLHNLSFVEDPTRVFRAVRFEKRLDFHMGRPTEHLLRSAVRQGFIDRVGGNRLFHELELILVEPDPWPAIGRMAELDLLKYVHPALQMDKNLPKLFAASSKVVHWYELLYLDQPCQAWQVYFLSLTATLDAAGMVEVSRRLNMSPRQEAVLTSQREAGLKVLAGLRRRLRRGSEPKASDLYRLLQPFDCEMLLFLMALSGHDRLTQCFSTYLTRLQQIECELSGDDLTQLGLPPGPLYREVLEELLFARLDGKVSSREDEVAFVRKRHLRAASTTVGQAN